MVWNWLCKSVTFFLNIAEAISWVRTKGSRGSSRMSSLAALAVILILC